MMRQLRESTKIVMIVVAISFVALMVFDWAMDLTGRSATASTNAVGTVNGEEIPIEEYQRVYENLVEQAREESPEGTVSEAQLRDLQERAWDLAVNAALLREETERREIRVTDDEVAQYIRSTPPPQMRESPAFQTNGSFDPAKYRRALADPQLRPTWDLYEESVRRELPLRRLQEQVLAGVVIGDRALEEAYRAANEQVRVDYLYLDPAVLIPDSAVSVSDRELRADYDERKEEAYARKATARIQAVSLNVRPTAADSAAAKAEIDSLRARAVAGEDFAELAREYSQDPGSAAQGGDLGSFARHQMVPEFDQVAFSLAEDQLSEPFLSPFGWHLVKAGKRETAEGGEERMRARHILLRVEPSEETFAAVEDSAAALAARIQERPQAFAEVASGAGLEVEAIPSFEQSDFVPGLGRVPEVAEWVFENAPGSVSEPLRSGSAVYVLKVEERSPAGFVPFEEVKDEIRRRRVTEKKLEKVAELVPRASELVRARGLEAAAAELGLKVAQAGPFTRAAELPEIGGGNAFIGTAFGLKAGQASGPIELENGVYYLRVAERKAPDMAPLEQQREAFRQQLLAQTSQQALEAWLDDLRKRAEIEDFRDEFLEASADRREDAPVSPPIF